jgi:hypothetical protein
VTTDLRSVLDAASPRDADELNASIAAFDFVLFMAGQLTTHDGAPPPMDAAAIEIVRRIRLRQIEAMLGGPPQPHRTLRLVP